MPIRSRAILAATLAFSFNASAALTNFPLPAGMCPLDEKVPEQALIVDYLRQANAGSNELLASFASCKELEAINQKKAISIRHYGSILRQSAATGLTMERATYTAEMATTYQAAADELAKAALTQARPAISNAAKANDLESPIGTGVKSRGVLFRDPNMVIIGMEQLNSFGSQVQYVASTAAMTLIDGASVSINLYAPLDKDAFAQSTALLKPAVNRLIKENEAK